VVVGIEEEELDGVGVFGKQTEIDALRIDRRPQRIA
jgi:hypothetical protein